MKETALGLLIPETGDPPAGPAQIGGNAEKADALLQKGGVGNHFWSGAELTRASTAFGSFSTPIKVEVPVVKPNQAVEINLLLFVLGGAPPPVLALRYENAAVGGGVAGFTIVELTLPTTGKYFPIGFGSAGNLGEIGGSIEPGEIGAAVSVAEGAAVTISSTINHSPLILKHKNAESKAVPIEIVGKIASGTAKIRGAWLEAHVRG